jgi:WXG100 family type VII secretion target
MSVSTCWPAPVRAAGFDASAARLRAAHARVTAALDDAREAVAAVTGQAADVLDGWVGPAGAAYAAGIERWRSGAELVLASLAESSAGLARAACDYDTADTTARGVVLASAP